MLAAGWSKNLEELSDEPLAHQRVLDSVPLARDSPVEKK
jgi:hypothetical protein